jgi:hypothetical protein
MLAFEVAGGRAAGEAVIDTLTIPERTASLGSVFTIVSHPPSTTHRQLDDAALAAVGISPGLLRCSVGLEDLDDLIADFERALAAAGSVSAPTASSPGPTDPVGAEPTPRELTPAEPASAEPTPV